MTDERPQRHLAAILAADIVGFSRLMGEDEAGTLFALTSYNNDLIIPCVAAHNGRVFKTTGDGLIAEFASVVDAVLCAIAFQDGVRSRNDEPAQSPKLEYRIGVNLGDVIRQGDDVFGDGVNISARLEGICTPGQVFLSGTVYDHVTGKVPVDFEYIGEREMKNIARPVRVYRTGSDLSKTARGTTDSPAGKEDVSVLSATVSDKPSIAVLAFDNMSDDPEQQYFAEGISEDIITDLSKVSGLFVIARNSSFAYRGQALDLRKVCEDLNVRYILEGSVRRSGKRARINAQMIDGSNGGHVWAERYDRDLEDIFSVQDEVTREIVSALKVVFTVGEQSRRIERRKVDPEAYDLLIRGRSRLYAFTREDLVEARMILQRAAELDPDMAEALALLSLVNSTEYLNGWTSKGVHHLDEALDFASRAIKVDPEEPWAYHALGLANLWKRQYGPAKAAIDKALALNPNFANAYAVLANIQDFSENHSEAAVSAERALGLDPGYDIAIQVLGRCQFAMGNDESAAQTFERRLASAPRSDMSRVFVAAAYGHLGRADAARRRWDEIFEISPEFSVTRVRDLLPYASSNVYERDLTGLRKAGLID